MAAVNTLEGFRDRNVAAIGQTLLAPADCDRQESLTTSATTRRDTLSTPSEYVASMIGVGTGLRLACRTRKYPARGHCLGPDLDVIDRLGGRLMDSCTGSGPAEVMTSAYGEAWPSQRTTRCR